MNTTDEQVPSPEEIQRKLPQYHNITLLSPGGMSLVYRAQESGLDNRDVALKVLTPELANDEEFRERFVREVSNTASLQHPNIIPIYAGPKSEDGTLHYIAMPLIDGVDLGTMLRDRGLLDLSEAVRIVRQVAAALDHTHNRNRVHRDVKPGNILLDRRTGHVYLCDFGIAKRLTPEPPLTQTGKFIGTPGYVSPEGIDGLPVDRRADVYALGAVLYQCLAGRQPYDQPGNLAKLEAQQDPGQNPPPLTALRADLPDGLDAVVATAMARRPQDRYPSCQRFVEELIRVGNPAPAQRDEVQTPPVIAGPDGPAGRPSRRPVLFAGLAVLAVLAVIGGILVAGSVAGDDDQTDVADELLARVPEPLRAGCQHADTGPDGAAVRLRCQDGADADRRDVRFDLFDGQSAMDAAYGKAIQGSGVSRASGDCAVAGGAEHRYPGVGTPVGRVLCYSRDGTTSLVWTDDEARTVARVQAREAEDIDLERSWSQWVGQPTFPAERERALLDLVELDQNDCRRAPASTLDQIGAVEAGVECEFDDTDSGARTISYFQFTNEQALERSYASDVSRVDAPSNAYCANTDKPLPGFLGSDRYDLRSVELGGLLCHPAEHGGFVIEWTLEPLLLMGRATGGDAEDLADWWDGHEIPPTSTVVRTLNEQAEPAFPTRAEDALLGRIPVESRTNCIRPPKEQIELNVGEQAVSSVTAAVVCGPTPGASIVFYYKFADRAGLDESVRQYGSGNGQDCRDAPPPPDFFGYAPYSRNGQTAGLLLCGTNDRKYPFLSWTHNELRIQVFAFQTEDVDTLLDWWNTTAGPL